MVLNFELRLLALAFVVIVAVAMETRQALEQDEEFMDTLLTLSDKVSSLSDRIDVLKTTVDAKQGSTYVRWGRTTCDANGTEIVYTGFAGGNWYRTSGGAADFICLIDQPVWANYDDDEAGSAKVYGAEYQMGFQFPDGGAFMFGEDLNQHDVPCVVCRTARSATTMTPGTNQCADGWALEYWGYIVSGTALNPAASNYACLDHRPEVEVGDSGNDNGKLMFVAEAQCSRSSLKCPPYVQDREITCAVCSKL